MKTTTREMTPTKKSAETAIVAQLEVAKAALTPDAADPPVLVGRG